MFMYVDPYYIIHAYARPCTALYMLVSKCVLKVLFIYYYYYYYYLFLFFNYYYLCIYRDIVPIFEVSVLLLVRLELLGDEYFSWWCVQHNAAIWHYFLFLY